MTTKQRLDAIISRYDLLNHPFYKAWNEGTLPVEALKIYAEEYGAFVGIIADGWETLGSKQYADEERYHVSLWSKFAESLGTEAADGRLPETQHLLTECRQNFATPETAAGAMYAFEVQQPETSKSKIAGLREHYSLGEEAEVYFHEHTANQHETRALLNRMAAMNADAQDKAVEACERTAKAMWDALSGIQRTVPESVC